MVFAQNGNGVKEFSSRFTVKQAIQRYPTAPAAVDLPGGALDDELAPG